jgi:hypothetical protein
MAWIWLKQIRFSEMNETVDCSSVAQKLISVLVNLRSGITEIAWVRFHKSYFFFIAAISDLDDKY